MQTVKLRNDGAVRTVEMNRPEVLNAFSVQLMDDLADAFLDATRDNSVKALILTGAGRAFSAGADLGEMGRPAPPAKHGFAVLLDAIVDFPKPFFIAVNGVGAGIGATLCGLADFVFIANEARLRCPFSSLGLTAEAASTYTFPRLMGRQRALWFLLAAEWLSGEECARAGLALRSVPLADLMQVVMAEAQKLAALPLASLTMTKELVMAQLREPMRAAILAENRGLAELVGSPANREALRAFREKRPADFTGL
ncbi:MAG: enoyl-CoA hydratase/isomerase family protein [Pseudomonadales bacterium]|nr:enoyl-CoA hydratase/isomerase family protein [Pseudomonadales bacterium]MCP5185979.1 enoyl-CoA hydratase/isomerase family protein [Pseudomonadales bacterium]